MIIKQLAISKSDGEKFNGKINYKNRNFKKDCIQKHLKVKLLRFIFC